ncbi:MAG: GAF domain-containing protein [Alkalinema sp. RU_4_3]|nr:GAF domain-containing protein [Alkalinema sp. RU_4_3]
MPQHGEGAADLAQVERSGGDGGPLMHGILGLVIHKGHSIRLPDLQKHPSRYGFPPHHPPMRSFLGVPIIGKRGVVGDLYFTEKIGADEFSAEDEAELLGGFMADRAQGLEQRIDALASMNRPKNSNTRRPGSTLSC